MIERLLTPYTYSAQELDCITRVGNNYKSKAGCIEKIKEDLKEHFDIYQNEQCCYCGLVYGVTGRGEIDHIAPQGVNYYPQFSFTDKNLAMACQLCNSSSMKHMHDSIDFLNADYNQCTFNIVHPYLDDHNYHYRWNGFLNVVISINNSSVKAQQSIRIFELDSEKRTKARAEQKIMRNLRRTYNLPKDIISRIRSAIL